MKPQRIELKEANKFVETLHRHHKPVIGHRFSVGAEKNGKLVGVAIVGRPVARACDQKFTAEVTRLCTDGSNNSCSFLYSLCARICSSMGFKKIQTYILETETGNSLIAAGWQMEAVTDGGSWNGNKRTGRRDDQPLCRKQRWVRFL